MTSRSPGRTDAAWIVLGRSADHVLAIRLDGDGHELGRSDLRSTELAAWVSAHENGATPPRWVWHDTAHWYPPLLAAGVRVARVHDLRLSHGILRAAAAVPDDIGLGASGRWDAMPVEVEPEHRGPVLFDLADATSVSGPPADATAALTEFVRQRTALARSTAPEALRLLVAAESAGALIAVEMRAAGLPWDVASHEAVLTDSLGARGVGGAPPSRVLELASEVRDALGDPAASLDSQPKLLRALHRAGVLVDSTSKWELQRHDHPVVAPLLEYKRLMRLYTANGWAWLDEWVRDGRFRPVYVPAGVVTGRWASSGGGALQIPRQLRTAVRADPGWVFVVADVAQLEPRVLAAMSRDTALAAAAHGKDLYAGIVSDGTLQTRNEAKVALLGAMYGATSGDSGRLVPRLRRAYPRAMRLVDEAARTGEEGGRVSTWLGRTSPRPSAGWSLAQSRASEVEASGGDESRARRSARDRGRFTRNFVVQGTAAEWALAWLADLRARLAALPPVAESESAPLSGPVFDRSPHLAMFLHDEIIVHAPAALADQAAACVRDAAASAGHLLFGEFPVDFLLDLRISQTAAKE